MNGYFELKPLLGGKLVFNLKAGNHEVILTSEIYESRIAALNGIDSVQSNGTKASSYEKKVSVKGEPYFVLEAANSQVIGKSKMLSGVGVKDAVNTYRAIKRSYMEATIEKMEAQ